MKWQLWMAAFGMVLASGCQKLVFVQLPRTDHYYVNPQVDFTTIGRIALLELDNQTAQPDLSETFTQVLADALGKRHLFSVQKVMRTDPLWQTQQLDNISSYSLDDLAAARGTLKVDAILFGQIRHYMSFPHLQIAINLKMVDTRSGKLIWAFEDVWDSNDKQVQGRMEKYFKEQMRTGYEPMNWQILITSPRAFANFVAYEIAETLPELPKNPVPRTVEYRRQYITTAQIVTDHEAHMTSIVLHLCLIVEARRASFWYARSAPRGG
ncbi:MAG: hypothetical protein GX298_04245, partial [Planctomycetes bacterium]|nr:hypothetical protein [Planctomycetota bacterium]